MTVSLYKILAIKQALESLNLLAIPVIEDNDTQRVVSMIIVGLADRPDEFNNLLKTISGEAKAWDDNLKEAEQVLLDFFALIPAELSVLINQLKSVSSTLENAVTQMMREEMLGIDNSVIPDQEQKQTTLETP
ncbi:MAG: hypothetical protein BWX53_00478 [Parcubacteria group bacterium ADurb.Bin016]|nr:MAG: hypothetical protein BWX53_00478 [Parcubacteria group bacterium ADurb.Bin016]